MIEKEANKALLTKIEYLSSHDGPGVRISLFFKGCTLQCKWCHNPETIHPFLDLTWNKRLCIGCRTCLTKCETGAISFDKNYIVNIEKCVKCFKCVETCPSKALNTIGRYYTVDELEYQVIQEEQMIKAMGGGITFSGGEPALHADFIQLLAKRLKKRNLNLALDTCGNVPWKNYEKLLPYIDLILYDLKEMDPIKHKEFTGGNNELIHSNFFKINKFIIEHNLSTHIWIRTPLIPKMNATADNLKSIGFFLSRDSNVVDRWELCAFNNLCNEKYNRLGINWILADTPLITESEMTKFLQIAQQSAPYIKHVSASGLNRK